MKKLLFLLSMMVTAIGCFAQADKGYHGFVDAGYTIGVGDYEFGRFEVSTTHGYQANPYFFIGAGVGFHFMQSYQTKGMYIALDKRDSKISIPLFADCRVNFSRRRFSPFIDLKPGYFVTNHDGFYGNVSVGCRMTTKGNQALYLSVGYTYEKLEFETFGSFVSFANMNYLRSSRKLDCEGVSIKLGYEF